MNYLSIVRIRLALAVLLTFASSLTVFAQTDPATKNIISRTAEVDGVRFHYMTAGKGSLGFIQ